MSEPLRPCPFCGSDRVSLSMGEKGDGTPWPYVECEECAACAEPNVWNRRSEPLRDERLREALAELVALRDLKDLAGRRDGDRKAALLGMYAARKDAAWAAARAALHPDTSPNTAYRFPGEPVRMSEGDSAQPSGKE